MRADLRQRAYLATRRACLARQIDALHAQVADCRLQARRLSALNQPTVAVEVRAVKAEAASHRLRAALQWIECELGQIEVDGDSWD